MDIQVDHSEVRTARTPHRCSSCSALICRGDRYEYGFIIYNGRKHHLYNCITCMKGSR